MGLILPFEKKITSMFLFSRTHNWSYFPSERRNLLYIITNGQEEWAALVPRVIEYSLSCNLPAYLSFPWFYLPECCFSGSAINPSCVTPCKQDPSSRWGCKGGQWPQQGQRQNNSGDWCSDSCWNGWRAICKTLKKKKAAFIYPFASCICNSSKSRQSSGSLHYLHASAGSWWCFFSFSLFKKDDGFSTSTKGRDNIRIRWLTFYVLDFMTQV